MSGEVTSDDKRFTFSITSLGSLPEGSAEAGSQPCTFTDQLMRECLEIWEDQQLDEEIRRDAQRSGYREKDAVAIVRQYRREKKERRAAS